MYDSRRVTSSIFAGPLAQGVLVPHASEQLLRNLVAKCLPRTWHASFSSAQQCNIVSVGFVNVLQCQALSMSFVGFVNEQHSMVSML